MYSSRRLGHGKASVTLDVYGHLINDSDDSMTKGNGRSLEMKGRKAK